VIGRRTIRSAVLGVDKELARRDLRLVEPVEVQVEYVASIMFSLMMAKVRSGRLTRFVYSQVAVVVCNYNTRRARGLRASRVRRARCC
jgi:uncharacterized membrane protein